MKQMSKRDKAISEFIETIDALNSEELSYVINETRQLPKRINKRIMEELKRDINHYKFSILDDTEIIINDCDNIEILQDFKQVIKDTANEIRLNFVIPYIDKIKTK